MPWELACRRSRAPSATSLPPFPGSRPLAGGFSERGDLVGGSEAAHVERLVMEASKGMDRPFRALARQRRSNPCAGRPQAACRLELAADWSDPVYGLFWVWMRC